MHQFTEILRLKFENHLSIREIARSCGVPPSTVSDYLQRAEKAQLGWPLPAELSEGELQQRLFTAEGAPPSEVRSLPDWAWVHQELRRPNVTLRLLWQEYHSGDPGGLKYSRYCELYRQWRQGLEPSLRLPHTPGEKLFVDWAGQKVPIHDPADGTVSQASVFVAAMGASHKIFAEAFAHEKLSSWITAHVHAYGFFGGVPALTVPDNPRTAVTKASRYEADLHRSYQELAEHYGTVILPARPAKPRDKAKVESAVQLAQRQILAALRDLRFFSVAELNEAIRPRLAQINAQPFQKLEGTRDQWFESLDRPHLKPLPSRPFDLAVWSEAKVNIDYHVAVENHYYSVPYALVHRQLQVRLSDTTLELFHEGQRVAAHPRSFERGKFTTLDAHRPKSHQRFLEWTPSRIVDWARQVGPECARAVEEVMASRPHPEQGFRSCLGILRLGKVYSNERLEAACRRALHFHTVRYRSIESILNQGLDGQPLESELPFQTPAHDNLRGREYFA